MSLTDKFYKNHELYITLKIKTNIENEEFKDCHVETNENTNEYTITFSHQEKDGMTLLLHFYKYYDTITFPYLSPCNFDFLLFKFFHHLYNLKHKPYFNTPNTNLSYSTIIISKYKLYSIYLRYSKTKFSSFLCALQVFNYFKLTNCSYCKLQIIHYLPTIHGVNKTFPDTLIVPTQHFHQILNYIDTNRKTSSEILNIYSKYKFFSNFVSLKNQPPQYFDVTFSNLPYPIQIEDFQIINKSTQYEKSYLNILCNDKNDMFFSFVHDSSFDEMTKSFQSILQNL